ncbi:hypothetical protein GCM10027569_01930 [Flindersiella endophytica]
MPHDELERIVRALYEAAAEYDRTKDPSPLIRLADDALVTARLHADPVYEKALSGAPEQPGDPSSAADVHELLARLRAPN